MEEIIEEILSEIQYKKLYTFKEIATLREENLNNIFKDFIEYPNNHDNYKNILSIITKDEYQYVDPDQLKKNDIILYLDLNMFYNLKPYKARVASVLIKDNHLKIRVFTENSTYKILNNKIKLFKLLSDEDKVRISLYEAINK